MASILTRGFFNRSSIAAAEELIGKVIVKKQNGATLRCRITETEAYYGESDTACHAHRGKTKRTEVLYREAGTLYVYLCYGMHNLLNIVTGQEGFPAAVLLRGITQAKGPGRLTRFLNIDRTYNGVSLFDSPLRIEDDGWRSPVLRLPRIGIAYASEEDQSKLWRFTMSDIDNCHAAL